MKKLLIVLPLLMTLSACNPGKTSKAEGTEPVVAKEEKPAPQPPAPVLQPDPKQPPKTKPAKTDMEKKMVCETTEVIATTDKASGKTERVHSFHIYKSHEFRNSIVRTVIGKKERTTYGFHMNVENESYEINEDGMKQLVWSNSYEMVGARERELVRLENSKFQEMLKTNAGKIATHGNLFRNKDGSYSLGSSDDTLRENEFFDDGKTYYVTTRKVNGKEIPVNKDEVYSVTSITEGNVITDTSDLQKPYVMSEDEKTKKVQELSSEICTTEILD